MNPDNILIYFNRGLLKMEIKDYEGAYNDFSQRYINIPGFREGVSGKGCDEHGYAGLRCGRKGPLQGGGDHGSVSTDERRRPRMPW